MAGAFDDLIPSTGGAAPAPAQNAFADLMPGGSRNFSGLYSKYGQQAGIDPRLIQAVSMTESSENPAAVGPTITSGPDKGNNATGLMQVTPSTAKDFGGGDLTDPDTNISIGTRTLRRALDAKGNYKDALNAYSGGGGDAYYNKVMGYYKQLGGDPTQLGWTSGLPANSLSGQAERLMGNPAPVSAPTQRGYDAVMHRPTNQGGLPGAVESALVGAVHGGIDVPANSLAEGAAWLGDQTGLTNGLSDQVQGRVNQRNQQYSDFAAQHPYASGFGNVAGGIGTAALLTPAVGGPIMGGLLGGAEYGAMQNSASGNPLWEDVLLNSGIGAGAGAVLKGISKYAAPYLAGKFPGIFRGAPEAAAPAGRIEPQFGPAASPPGEAAPRPTPTAGLSSADAAEALAAQQRRAAFEALGMRGEENGPTRGMLSQNPAIYTYEQNLAKTDAQEGGGEMLNRLQAVNAGLKNAIDEIHAGTGATATSLPEASQNVAQVLQAKWREMQANNVSPAYKAVMRPDNVLSPEKFAELTQGSPLIRGAIKAVRNDPLEGSSVEGMPDESLPVLDLAKRHLDDIEAEATRAGKGNRARIAGDAAADFVSKLDEAFPGYAEARATAEERFHEFETPGMKSLQKGKMAPEQVITRIAHTGQLTDVRALKNSLLSGTPEQIARGRAALNEVQAQTIERIMAKGFGENGAGKYSAAGVNAEVKRIGLDRLKILLEPGQLAALRHLQMAGDAAFKEPAFAAVNHSNSGIFAVHQASKMAERAKNVIEKVEAWGGPILETLPGGGLVTRAARGVAGAAGRMGERAAVRQTLNPNIDAEIAAHVRRTASAPIQRLLSRLPISQATAALLNQPTPAPSADQPLLEQTGR